jgi:RNA polymerase sigma-70 factor (ECF subfamily)
LHKLYAVGIFVYLHGLVGNSEVPHDLAQQTFLQAWLHLSQLREAARFKAWLYQIARRVATDYLRSELKGGYKLSWEQLEEDHFPRSDPGFETLLEEEDRLRQALATLPFKLRECLLLYTIGGFSLREIAAILDLGEQSVETYISKARKQLRTAWQHFERDTH